jgi:hypothetical protein
MRNHMIVNDIKQNDLVRKSDDKIEIYHELFFLFCFFLFFFSFYPSVLSHGAHSLP